MENKCKLKNKSQEYWTKYYSSRIQNNNIYPTEWVVRTLAGANYPQMKLDKTKYNSSRILDLSCGDGRNLKFLQDLGFDVYATEISDEIISELEKKKITCGWNVEFRKAKNTNLPYENNFFQYILACWSIYYLEPNIQFVNVVKEVARILDENGYFIGGFPDTQNFVLKNAINLPDGSVKILNDPYNLRNGERWIIVRDQNDVVNLLKPYFKNISVGHLVDNYFGLMVSGYIFVCQKA